MEDDNDDMPVTIMMATTADILEKHTLIFLEHKELLKSLSKEVAEIKERVGKLEKADSSLNSSDADFLKDVTTRLQKIGATIPNKL